MLRIINFYYTNYTINIITFLFDITFSLKKIPERVYSQNFNDEH